MSRFSPQTSQYTASYLRLLIATYRSRGLASLGEPYLPPLT